MYVKPKITIRYGETTELRESLYTFTTRTSGVSIDYYELSRRIMKINGTYPPARIGEKHVIHICTRIDVA